MIFFVSALNNLHFLSIKINLTIFSNLTERSSFLVVIRRYEHIDLMLILLARINLTNYVLIIRVDPDCYLLLSFIN